MGKRSPKPSAEIHEIAGLPWRYVRELPVYGYHVQVFAVSGFRKRTSLQGMYTQEHHTIIIDADMSAAQACEVEMHEFMHAAIIESGLFLEFQGSEDFEERLVRTLALLLHQAGYKSDL